MFGPRYVDAVISSFRKTLEQLEAVAQFHEAKAEQLLHEIAAARSSHAESRDEADRARTIALKLDSLIS